MSILFVFGFFILFFYYFYYRLLFVYHNFFFVEVLPESYLHDPQSYHITAFLIIVSFITYGY